VLSLLVIAGTISVLCSTTSLAYGVNLPARRVIIKDSFKAFDSPANRITATEYKQMSGRAGRAGIDTQGESILMVRPDGSNRQQLQALVQVRRLFLQLPRAAL
jgi:replicative superfamily II helicase